METIGRTSEVRTITLTRTSGSAAVTGSGDIKFTRADVGQPITGTGLPAGATIAAVASGTAATLSTPATSSGTSTAQLGGPQSAQAYGFIGWSPETEAEADSYTIAGINAGLPQPEAGQRSRKKPTP